MFQPPSHLDKLLAPALQSTNAEVYDTTLKDLVSGVPYGINTTVFAYGATGSGKTFTMVGECWRVGKSYEVVLLTRAVCHPVTDEEGMQG